MDIRQTNCPSMHKGDTWGVLGVNIQKSGKAVKRLDRLAPPLVHACEFIWEWTNPSRPSIPQEHWGGGGRGSQIQNCWEAVKRLNRLAPNFSTSANSSGIGHRLNTIHPTIPQGHLVFFRGSQIQMFEEAVKRLHRLAPNLVQICGFVWEWT